MSVNDRSRAGTSPNEAMQDVYRALVADARAHGETWSLDRSGRPAGEIRRFELRSAAIFDGADRMGATARRGVSTIVAASTDEHLEAASHLITGTATRLLASRLQLLYRFAARASRAARSGRALALLRSNKRRAAGALSVCLKSSELEEARSAFESATRRLIGEFGLARFDTTEFALAYWDAVESVAAETIVAVREYLAALDEYGRELCSGAIQRRHAFLRKQQRQFRYQIDLVIAELDGQRLHQGKERMRRELESTVRPGQVAPITKETPAPHGLMNGLLNRIGLGGERRASASDTITRGRAAGSALEESFNSVQREKQEYRKKRDLLRSQLQSIEAELQQAGVHDAQPPMYVSEPQPDILDGMDALRNAAHRMERLREPLDLLLEALEGVESAGPVRGRLAEFARLVDSIAQSKAFVTGSEVINQLLRVMWLDPVRLLNICMDDIAKNDQAMFDSGTKRIEDLPQWLRYCQTEARKPGYSLEHYIAVISYAVPERLASAMDEECRLMFLPHESLDELVLASWHDQVGDRRLGDRRAHDRRRAERRTNVIEVDFERRRRKDRRIGERRVGPRRAQLSANA